MARRYLPEARSRLLAVSAAVIAVFYAVLAIAFAVNVMRSPAGLVLSPLFALLAWGMWKLARFARWVTIIWIWIMVIVMPLGIFAPRDATDAIYWGTLLAAVTPFVVAGLFFIYVFGKHKREFKWP